MNDKNQIKELKEELKVRKEEVRGDQASRRAAIDQASNEAEQLANRLATFQRSMQRQQRSVEELIATTDADIQRLSQEPPSARREHDLYLAQLRRQVALRQIEFIKILCLFNPRDPQSLKVFAANQPKLDLLKIESRFLAQEYTVANYRPVSQAIESYLSGGASASPTAAPPRPGTGPLSARQAGTGPLSARAGQVPARPGTGPLSARAATPGQATGPLSARTGPLSARSAGVHPALQALQSVQLTPIQRQNLEAVILHFKEVDSMMAPLRGPELQLGLPHAQAADLLNKVNGKVYYIKRSLQGVGPAAERLAFEPEEMDSAWQEMLAKQAVPLEDAPANDKQQSLTGRLKSFFNFG